MLNVNIISNVMQHINLRFQVFQATKWIMFKLLFKDFFIITIRGNDRARLAQEIINDGSSAHNYYINELGRGK